MAAERVAGSYLDRKAPRRSLHALLAVTAFVRVPVELYDASRQDFSGGSGDVLLILFGAGMLLFLVLNLGVAWLPSRLRSLADAALVGLAVYAWTRSNRTCSRTSSRPSPGCATIWMDSASTALPRAIAPRPT